MRKSKIGFLLGVLVSLGLPAIAPAADGKSSPAKLSAAQIVQKHLAARGGTQAWAGVQSMVWNGKMDLGYGDAVARSRRYLTASASHNGKGARGLPPWAATKNPDRKQLQVPFVLEMKRPGKSRVELEFSGKTAVQVFDGAKGWLLRPYLNRDDWEPFSPEQAKAQQQDKWELGGPLMDYAARGTTVSVVSMDKVEGHDAYQLALTQKSGEVQHVWVDAKSFLDVKVEGTPRRMDGKLRAVFVTEREFHQVQGVMVPFVLETAVDGSTDTHRMVIEKVALNPRLADARFTKPKT